MRPIVVRGDAIIRVEPLDLHVHELLVSFDGQETATLGATDTLEVRRAPGQVVLVRFGDPGFFKRLREKLHWGDLSDREL